MMTVNLNEGKMLSLYDFLGRAAGNDVGERVFKASVEAHVLSELREISNSKYTGTVRLYPESFLKHYFGK